MSTFENMFYNSHFHKDLTYLVLWLLMIIIIWSITPLSESLIELCFNFVVKSYSLFDHHFSMLRVYFLCIPFIVRHESLNCMELCKPTVEPSRQFLLFRYGRSPLPYQCIIQNLSTDDLHGTQFCLWRYSWGFFDHRGSSREDSIIPFCPQKYITQNKQLYQARS